MVQEYRIANAVVRRVIKETTGMLISPAAVRGMRYDIEQILRKIAQSAGHIAKKSGRKTIQMQDLSVATTLVIQRIAFEDLDRDVYTTR